MSDMEAERLCECGCGEVPRRAKRTYGHLGMKKGDQYRFVNGHHNRKSPHEYLPEDRGFSTPCWIWQRSTMKCGYGVRTSRASGEPTTEMAHRMMWRRLRTPIPPGYVLDHLCGQKACVNPDHLEPVTQQENVRRATIENLAGDAHTIVCALLKHPKRDEIARALIESLPPSEREHFAA